MILKIDRKRIENLWYYYKAHLIGVVFIIVSILFITGFFPRDAQPDFVVSYMPPAHNAFLNESAFAEITNELSPMVKDINKDGKSILEFHTTSDSFKIGVTLRAGEADIHLCEKNKLQKVAMEGLLLPLDEYIDRSGLDIGQYSIIKLTPEFSEEEHVYGISLENSKFMQEHQLYSDDMFFAVRRLSGIKKNVSKRTALYESAYQIFEYMLFDK